MKKIIQLLDTFRQAESIFLNIAIKKLAECSNQTLVELYNQTFEAAISTSDVSLEAFRAQGYEFARRFEVSPISYPEEKVLQASGPIQSTDGGWCYLAPDHPNTPPVIDRSPLIDELPLREIAPPDLKRTLYWTIRYRRDPEFAKVRFKRLERGYPDKVEYPLDLMDVVEPEVFFANEANRLPFFVGSQFGLLPFNREYYKYMNDKARIAVLGKSILSGVVSGLSIREIEWIDGESKSPYRQCRILREVRRFAND
jgi:hypothetical protein